METTALDHRPPPAAELPRTPPVRRGTTRPAVPPMELTYAVQMLLGTLVLVAGAHLLAERAAAHGTATARRRG
ncbi:hypothetical protein [Streptomyces sp. H39-S7]|uniref:hypothetical protein n=1 Tax=Streptomyces sp. H39-S7 TaxID=3004357 RepID=UPI0022AF833D|nr:hypothetical protein [Streptomyces sp. H39-S7]MCZ4119164.1 hypothetical protein [Streptomyces sp. H39-S7]